jgi:hypothetical protein
MDYHDIYDYLTDKQKSNNTALLYLDIFNENYMNLNSIKNNQVIFDADVYIHNLYNSYSNDKNKILYQLSIDVNRIKDIIINNKKITKLENITQLVLSEDKIIFLSLLCTQAVFFLPFSILNKLYTFGDNLLISPNKDRTIIIDDQSYNICAIFTVINIKKDMKILDIRVNLTITLNFNNPDYPDKYHHRFGYVKWSIISV